MNGRDMVVVRFYIASQIVPTEASLLDPPGMSLIVPDFTISVYGSSCNFFLSHSLFFSFYFYPVLSEGCHAIIKEEENDNEKYKIAWTAVHKNESIYVGQLDRL